MVGVLVDSILVSESCSGQRFALGWTMEVRSHTLK